MTVTTTLSTKQYSGNGSTTVFAFPYKIIDGAHFVVSTLISATNVMTIHTKDGSGTYDYTVAVAADLESANVTFLTAPPTGYEITIDRQTTKTQPTDYTPNDDFPAETHERALDRATLLHQDLNNDYKNNAIRFDPNTADQGGVTIIKTVAQRQNKIISFDGSGDISVTQEIGTSRGNWATATTYFVRDIVIDTVSSVYICKTAHTSSGSSPISTNTDAAKWDIIINGSAASTSATAAATSATAAATSATAAATSATAGATSATASATSATASATSATGAASSASSASTSAAAAATSYDNFDDRYLGQKSADVSVDNDGASLLTGALYFNTSNNVMMAYTGSAWVRTTPTSSDQTNINTLSASAVITDMDLLGTSANVAAMALLGTSDAIADMNVLGTADVVTDLNTLGTADVVADMNVLGTADVVADLNTLGTADVVTDMNTLATSANVTAMGILATSANVTAMGLLGTSAVVTDLGILGTADVVTDMNVLATSDVVTDMNTLATADIVSDMNTLGTSANVTAMATCATNIADVNNFVDQYTISATSPGSPSEGDLWYDSSNNVLKVHNGTSFVAVTSATSGITDVADDTTPQLGGNLDLQTYTLSNVSLANGGFYSNPNTITADATVTTAALTNMFLMGQITVNDTYTWTIAGDGVLSII